MSFSCKEHGMSTKCKVVCSDLISAVIEEDLDLVQLLVSYGADVNISASHLYYCKHNLLTYEFPMMELINQTSTCLMFAVNSPQICRILLKSGADVNYKNENNLTALHYASKEGNLDTVKLLLEHGAEYSWPGSKNNVLQYAAVYSQKVITEYLIANTKQSLICIIHAYELLGASLVSISNAGWDIRVAWLFTGRSSTVSDVHVSYYWMKAMELRHENVYEPLLKVLPEHSREVYHNVTEPETVAQLKSILDNEQDLPDQALLIFERILGNNSLLFMDKLKYILEFYSGINILKYGTSILEDNRDLIPTNLYIYVLLCYRYVMSGKCNIDVIELIHNLSIALSTLVEYKSTLYGTNLMIETYRGRIMILFLDVVRNWMSRGQPHKEKVISVIEFVVGTLNPTDAQGRTILHVAIANLYTDEYGYIELQVDAEHIAIEAIEAMQPRYDFINLLLLHGCTINQRDKRGRPALFEKTNLEETNFFPNSFPFRKLMVSYGAHVDIPSVHLPLNIPPFNSLLEISLQCLTARAVVRAKIAYRDRDDVPPKLVSFISLHDTDLNNLNL